MFKSIVFGFSLLGATSSVLLADAAVWKIANGEHSLYLGGTIHVLSSSDYPLPEEFNFAYERAELVVLEADLSQLQDPSALPQLLSSMMYTDGSTLDSVLSAATMDELRNYCQKRGVPLALLLGMKPGLVMMTITALELERLGLSGTGVDQFFAQRAASEEKPLQFFETVSEQIGFLSNLGKGNENEFISFNLTQLGDLESLFQSIKAAWREGDLLALETFASEQMKSQFPSTFDDLVSNRNLAWFPKIEAMLDNPPTEFVLVGALHLAGEEGLLGLLQQRGYAITRVRVN